MKERNWRLEIKHLVTLVIGILIMSLGVAISKIATLGTSPISSIPNVLSFIVPLTIGQTTMILMVVLIILEWIILRRDFNWQNLIQLIPSFLFGIMIDYFVRLLDFLTPTNYLVALAMTLVSIVILAIGVYFEVNARSLVMAGEGIAAAIAFVTKKPFGQTKVRADITMVVVAVLISLIFTGKLIGVREGTVLSAVFAGRIVDFLEFHFEGFTNWLNN